MFRWVDIRKSAWIFYGFDTPENEIAKAKDAGCDTIICKGSDGRNLGDAVGSTVFIDHLEALIPVAQAAGLRVVPYCYIYGGPVKYDPGNNPTQEADAVAKVAAVPGVAGIVFDAEYEYVNRIGAAATFFGSLLPRLPLGFRLAFTTDLRLLVGNGPPPWSVTEVNLDEEPWPWSQFVARCQAIFPQLYWTDFELAPSDVISPLLSVWQNSVNSLGWPKLEVIPTLPGNATPSDFAAGIAEAIAAGCTSISVWTLVEMSADLTTILKEASVPNPQTEPTYTVGPGIAAAMKAAMDKPCGDEKYIGEWLSFAPGEKGIYVYSKQANRTYFLKAS